MKTISNLTGIATEQPAPEMMHCAFAVHDSPVPGFMRQFRAGVTGVHLKSLEGEVFIPMQAFWDLAAANDATFRVPAVPAPRGGK